MIELVGFWLLAAATFSRPEARARLRDKPRADWVLDLSGLAVQGALVPLAALLAVAGGLRLALPAWSGAVEAPGVWGFLLAFVGVDYLYYWNHRLLHARGWPLHRVHHSVTTMDVLGTSRNTLWTSALIVYVWASGLALFLLDDPRGYALGAACTAVLDLWRHSPLDPPPAIAGWLSPWLILPADHARHHEAEVPRGNYGANLKLWDRLHGTALDGPGSGRLGHPTGLGLTRALLWPFP